jgi:hypothetical protein
MADERTGRRAGDASTRHIHIMGLTRRAETHVHASHVTGNDKIIMGRVASHGVLPRYSEKNLL